jgi:hypothetical protein
VKALPVLKPLSREIRESKMRHPYIRRIPDSGIVARAGGFDRLAKECQLESESPLERRKEIARVVPPLSLKIGMVEMIAGKRIAITGPRDGELRGGF